MPLLYYWRRDNYYRDIDYGASFNLNQSNKLLHEIEIGDSLWAFTRNKNNNYALATQLVIKAKTFNSSTFRYGKYRVWGDLKLSKYFKIENQPNIEHILRNFSIKTKAKVLGRAFQGKSAVRKITIDEHNILQAYVKNLEDEVRARLIPEDKLEALLLNENDQNIYNYIKSIPSGISEKRINYLYTKAPQRNARLVKLLQEMYSGKCQLCQWDPKNNYGHSLCEAHHINWISRGGEDILDNMILLCPNHHSAVHRVDAVFDYKNLIFKFNNHEEKIKLNSHLS